MLKARIWIPLFFVLYLLFALVNTPVIFIWEQVSPHLQVRNIKISNLNGTLWQGSGNISFNREMATVKWHINPASLLMASVAGDITITNPVADVSGHFSAEFSGFKVRDLHGYLEDKLVNPYLSGYKLSVSGRLWVETVSFQGTYTGVVSDIDAKANWTGGDVRYPVGRDMHTRDIPAMDIIATPVADKTTFSIRDKEAKPIVSGELQADGWMIVNIHKHIVEVAKEAWPTGNQDVIFSSKQKVF
ncbi:type II secretion system protein N [Gynuella sp.]|uniref:type II secretion system protein N n=1 Tax=Gynuella sp. TaxID=2969146 RepID=UPI003D10A10C